MANQYTGVNPEFDDPGIHAAAVTRSDSVDLPKACRALHIGVAGTIKVTTSGGDDVSFIAGQGILPVSCSRVWLTGTSATDIVAIW